MESIARSVLSIFALAFLVFPVALLAEPYQSTPSPIPGKIELENYDTGGEGVAYHDTTPGNTHGGYRNDDVDIVADDNGINYVAETKAGEWLQYTANIAYNGHYTLSIAFASNGRGGTFHVEFNGVDKTGSVRVPDTGGWQSWIEVKAPPIFQLDRGPATVRVVFDSDGETGYVGSIDYIVVNYFVHNAANHGEQQSDFLPHFFIPGTFEAEWYSGNYDTTPGNSFDANSRSDVDVARGGHGEGSRYVADTKASEWLTYAVNIALGGPYELELTVASDRPGGTLHFEISGVDVTGPMDIPDTGGWQQWTVIRRNVVLPAGASQTLRLVMDAEGSSGYVGSLDFIRFNSPRTQSSPFGAPPDVRTALIQAENYDIGGQNAAYFDTTVGNAYGGYRGDDVDIVSDSGHTYLAETRAGEWLQYTVYAPRSSVYEIFARTASEGRGGRMHIEIDGIAYYYPFSISRVGDTSGWQNFTGSVPLASVVLLEGLHTLRLVFDDEGPTGYVGSIEYLVFYDLADG